MLKKYIIYVNKAIVRFGYIGNIVIRSSPLYLAVIILCSLIEGIVPVVSSFISSDILEKLTFFLGGKNGKEIFEAVFYLIVFKSILLFLQNVSKYSRGTMLALAGARVIDYIRKQIMNKAKNIDIKYYDLPSFYTVLDNAKKEVGSRPLSIITSCTIFFSALISMVSYTMILARFSIRIVVLIIAITIPRCIFLHIYRKKSYLYNQETTQTRRKLSYYNGTVTSPSFVKELKVFGLFDWFHDKYKQTFEEYFGGLKEITWKEFRWELLLSLLSAVVNFGIFLYVSLRTCYGDIGIGEFSLYTTALTSITGLMITMSEHMAAIYSGTLFIDNLYDFLNTDFSSKKMQEEIVDLQQKHIIKLSHVSFCYPGSSKKVLDDISLTINSGETIVLMGLNGSGKSTLIKLLLRLYEPSEGMIYLDGRDIQLYPEKELYKLYSVVFQDYARYPEMIKENIRFGDINKKENMEEIDKAATKGWSKEFIYASSKKYETPLSKLFYEDGVELSGGQWQKLAISRAFYKNAAIYIFDEPTASLDAESEKAIMDEIMNMNETSIRILVSHRQRFLKRADKIIVLENGRIIEMGSHEELLDKGRRYTSFMQGYSFCNEKGNEEEHEGANCL